VGKEEKKKEKVKKKERFWFMKKYDSVRFEVYAAVTMKNAVFWDVTPCSYCKNRRFGGRFCLHHQDDKNQRTRNRVSSN
jgi:hypothetical protein